MNDIAPETDLGSLGEADVVLLGPALLICHGCAEAMASAMA